MMLKVCLVFAAALSLVSCLNVGYLVQNARKEGIQVMNIVEKGASDTVVKTVGKGASDTVNTVGKEGAQTMNIVEKGAADTVKTAEDVVMLATTEVNDSSCACVNYTCGCCLQLVVEEISLNETGCLNISYLPDEYGFLLVFTLNGKVIISEKISVKNPPPICAPIPYSYTLASLCLKFYDLDYKKNKFSGCADIEITVEGFVVDKLDLGCFQIPPGYGHFLTKVTRQ